LEQAVAERDRTIADLEEELDKLQAQLAKLSPKHPEWSIAAFVATEPMTNQVTKVSEWAAKHFPSSLAICKEFQAECEEIGDGYKKTEKLYTLLSVMGMYYSSDPKWTPYKEKWLQELGKQPGSTCSIAEVFKLHNLRAGQSGQSNVDDYSAYTIRHDKVDWSLTWHAGDSSRSSKSTELLRVYYADDKERNRFIVGRGPGKHLPIGSRPT